MEWIVFGLAYAAYRLVCADVAARAWRKGGRWLTACTAFTAVAHVALVWIVRFEGSFEVALSRGWAGFAIFHVALALIVAASTAPGRWSGRLMLAAFPIVSLGAIGAAFKYEFVSVLRIPLIAAFAAAAILASLGWRRFRAVGSGP
jgi:hypothetical protein